MNNKFREQGTEYAQSAYRKQYSIAKKFYEAGVFNKFSENDYITKLDDARRELERMKIQYRDERNAWQRQNYSEARMEETLDKLADDLRQTGRVIFNTHRQVKIESSNDMIVLLSDLHIGENFDNFYGKYNTDIAARRLGEILDSIFDIRDANNCQNCHVFLLGDCISGNFRRSIQVENKQNVIDQIKKATELVSSFCYELTKHFNKVSLYSVAGNHSRFQLSNDDDIFDERLDDIVAWGVGLKLSHIENFDMPSSNIDNSLAVASIRGKTYALVHGDNGDPTKNDEVLKIVSVIGFKPYAICCGHLHSVNYSDCSGVKIIRGGSLCGAGNQFTRKQKLIGMPEQIVATIDQNGIRALYPIEFSV